MLRIGILNFAGHMNHGANLTAYALQHLFNKWGHHAQNLHLHSTPFDRKIPQFARFADDNIMLSTTCAAGECGMQNFNKEYDVFIVGSDQVWREAEGNTSYWKWKTPHYACYHLAFAQPGKRRIAVASSFGNEEYNPPENIRASIAQELKRFAAVSVREHSAIKTVKSISGLDAQLLIDPVFYINTEEWKQLITQPLKRRNGKKLIAYNSFFHNNEIEIIKQDLKNEYEFYDLCSCDTYTWLSVIQNSEFVITDSFHVLCFCLIFGTPFICLTAAGQGEARFKSLQQLLGFSKHRIIKVDSMKNLTAEIYKLIDTPEDWASIHSRIGQYKTAACSWLKNALTCPIPKWSGPPYRKANS